jgi:hypothetical protein
MRCDSAVARTARSGSTSTSASALTSTKSIANGRPSSVVAITPSRKGRSGAGPTSVSGAVRFIMPALASRPGKP